MAAPPYDTFQPFCNDDAVSIAKTQNTQKKPRHRHTPYQLAALNELFEQNEHPPLEQRTALADRLGMETKTVNAWFQNKRASSKKRVKGGTSNTDSHSTNNKSPSVARSTQQKQSKGLRRPEPKNSSDDSGEPSPSKSAAPSKLSLYKHSSGRDPPPRNPTNSDNLAHDSRSRPSEAQIDELRKIFNINSHPTPEDRQAVSASLGMTYEKVTNWFQNQRYLAKKKSEDDDHASRHSVTKAGFNHETHLFSAYPTRSYPRPSSGLPTPTSHPSLGPYSAVRRSPSPSMDDRSPRRSLSRPGATPYRTAVPAFVRTRRSRPEPYQLEALKKLFRKTATPTIEERSAIALEIGMDVGKVTNWFRNLRQTARRRAKKTGSGEDDDDDSFHARDPYSASSSLSPSGTPSPGSPEMFIKAEDSMDTVDFDDDHRHTFSVDNSEEEYQEAVTPPPELSSSPPSQAISSRRASAEIRLETLLARHVPYAMEIDKVSVEQFPGIRMEDALLLLSFHHHIVQY